MLNCVLVGKLSLTCYSLLTLPVQSREPLGKLFKFDVSCLPEDNLQVGNNFYFERFMRKKQVHSGKIPPATVALINQKDIYINNEADK